MKYLSLDTETLGLNPEEDSIIQVGYVLDDLSNQKPEEELVKRNFFVQCEKIHGSPDTIEWHRTNGLWERWMESLNKKTFDQIFDQIYWDTKEEFKLSDPISEKINLAGKNLAMFDLKFLNRIDGFPSFFDRFFHRRIIDPAMFYTDLTIDKVLPNLTECKSRAGLKDTEVTHDALDDAMDVVKLMRIEYERQLRS